jgi:hypothetical protein
MQTRGAVREAACKDRSGSAIASRSAQNVGEIHRQVFGVLALVGIISMGCSSSSTTPAAPSSSSSSSPSSTVSLLLPSTLSLAVGDTSQLRTVEVLPDGTTQILTNSATWHSSNTSVATVSESAIVTAVDIGTAMITVTASGASRTMSVIVSATSAATRAFLGTAAGQGASAGTLILTLLPNSRVSANLYLAHRVTNLLGRVDSPTNIVDVSGGGYTLLGAISNGVLSGTFTDPASNGGGFSALESTHTAVTTFCGTYMGDNTTSLGNPDTGVWNLELSVDGAASGDSLPTDGSGPPLIFVGRADSSTFNMIGNQGSSASGTFQNGTATGTFQPSAGGIGTFSASTSACH